MALVQRVKTEQARQGSSVKPLGSGNTDLHTPVFFHLKEDMGRSAEEQPKEMMKLYILKSISNRREIRCERCGAYENLEIHHKKYEDVTISDLELLCQSCHRNVTKENNKMPSNTRTVFIDGKRYCETTLFRFPY